MKNKYVRAFTMIESLISLEIISICFSVLSLSLIKSKSNYYMKEALLYRKMNSEKFLTEILSNVCIPYWKNDFCFNYSTTSIELNYYHSNPNLKTINLPDYISLQKLEPLKNKDNYYGFICRYYIQNHDELITLVVPFRSIPFGE